jgi:dTDP-glucose pyrophosphorylase
MTTLIIPMVGLGTRMKLYSEVPKPLIPIAGKPMFYWSVMSALSVKSFDELVFCYRREEEELFNQTIKHHFPFARHQLFESITNGQAETIYMTNIDSNSEFSIVDSDLYFEIKSPVARHRSSEWCELLWTESKNPGHSFIEITDSRVNRIAEKNPISNLGIVGFYSFSSKNLFDSFFLKVKVNKEIYVSNVISLMIDARIDVSANAVSKHLSFGTYEEFVRDSKELSDIK